MSWVSALMIPYAFATRSQRRSRSESGYDASKTDIRNYRITIKNLHERAVPVTVLDQIPVSQNTDIKVELLGKSAPTKRDVDDKRGVLAWELKLRTR